MSPAAARVAIVLRERPTPVPSPTRTEPSVPEATPTPSG